MNSHIAKLIVNQGITGANRQLGRLVVEKLKQSLNSEDLIGLVRSPEKAADLGIEVRVHLDD